MKVILTNDDGYSAPGIWALADIFRTQGNEVVIVAPEGQQSALSHAVTLHKPLRLKRAAHLERDGIKVYYTSGTPSDAALIGLFKVMPDADILVSGINSGPNLGEDVLYSGTVGAAMEGALIGVRSIAVSLADYGKDEYNLAAHFTTGIAEQLAASDLPKRTVLNINVPPVTPDQYKGLRITTLGTRKYKDVLQERVDPRGQKYYWIAGEIVREDDEPGTDNHAVSSGYISITPILLDLTHKEMLKNLNFTDDFMKAGHE